MSAEVEHSQLIGAYVLNTLEPAERSEVDAHVAECETCRNELAELEALKEALGEVPPEALLHGPPDADLVLQRTLRQIREEKSSGARWQRGFTIAAAAVVLVAAIGGGVLVGRGTGEPAGTQDPRVAQSAPAGTRVASAVDPSTDVRMTASVIPAAGWVRINAAVAGIPPGEDCRLIVVSADGDRQIAGGWVVSAAAETAGTTLDGSASIAPADVAAIEVVNTAGRTFISMPI
ncbi:zf-HC2 domain-containing protein [Catenuloplanes atrovinosus]|uniref:Anti-sigma-YlaC factor YlaD n=1 Tax=Catenuloplanes atrovinosus TaxID=137266 RepID=A0AAE4C8E6_9ACTN|nr:zf-HC2 domain-containing protein [Catenuloplanes atrovinosus]MDR7274918.1 putative anti-sigma-YlaC factor YlaD [Catenuloplanes atrovinosus]